MSDHPDVATMAFLPTDSLLLGSEDGRGGAGGGEPFHSKMEEEIMYATQQQFLKLFNLHESDSGLNDPSNPLALTDEALVDEVSSPPPPVAAVPLTEESMLQMPTSPAEEVVESMGPSNSTLLRSAPIPASSPQTFAMLPAADVLSLANLSNLMAADTVGKAALTPEFPRELILHNLQAAKNQRVHSGAYPGMPKQFSVEALMDYEKQSPFRSARSSAVASSNDGVGEASPKRVIPVAAALRRPNLTIGSEPGADITHSSSADRLPTSSSLSPRHVHYLQNETDFSSRPPYKTLSVSVEQAEARLDELLRLAGPLSESRSVHSVPQTPFPTECSGGINSPPTLNGILLRDPQPPTRLSLPSEGTPSISTLLTTTHSAAFSPTAAAAPALAVLPALGGLSGAGSRRASQSAMLSSPPPASLTTNPNTASALRVNEWLAEWAARQDSLTPTGLTTPSAAAAADFHHLRMYPPQTSFTSVSSGSITVSASHQHSPQNKNLFVPPHQRFPQHHHHHHQAYPYRMPVNLSLGLASPMSLPSPIIATGSGPSATTPGAESALTMPPWNVAPPQNQQRRNNSMPTTIPQSNSVDTGEVNSGGDDDGEGEEDDMMTMFGNMPQASIQAMMEPTFREGQPCSHHGSWRRVRSKRGFNHFSCEFCGAKWRVMTTKRREQEMNRHR